VKAGVWRLLRMLLTSLIAAIKPHASFAAIRAKATALRRHLREPPRKRTCQAVSMLS
jgi:hypothetical protein